MSSPHNPERCAVLDRQERVFKMRVSGLQQDEIARILGVSQPTVSNDLKAAFNRQKERVAEEGEHYVRLDLQRVEEMLLAIWPKVQEGNERAIATALQILTRRARLLGLDAVVVQKIEVSNPNDPDSVRRELEAALAARQGTAPVAAAVETTWNKS